MWIWKSIRGHESDLDELGVVGKRALSAIERHQNYHQPTNIDAFHGHVLIFGHFGQISLGQKTSKLIHFGAFLA